jgi:hypothetical protein
LITLADWQAEGLALFGEDPDDWQFICPACGLVQTPGEFRALGMGQRMIDTIVSFACIRRWTDQDCMSAGKGPVLIHISDTEPDRPTFDWNKP